LAKRAPPLILALRGFLALFSADCRQATARKSRDSSRCTCRVGRFDGHRSSRSTAPAPSAGPATGLSHEHVRPLQQLDRRRMDLTLGKARGHLSLSRSSPSPVARGPRSNPVQQRHSATGRIVASSRHGCRPQLRWDPRLRATSHPPERLNDARGDRK
jgi:hypothetical protein